MGYKFLAEDERDENGVSVATIGDIDGDGLADFLIGAWRADGIGNAETWSGSTYLIKAADLPALDLADGTSDGVINLGFVRSVGTSYEIVGEDQGHQSGGSVSSAGDVDNDGKADLLIGAPNASNGPDKGMSGSVYLVNANDLVALDGADGATNGVIDLGQVAATGTSYKFTGKDAFDQAGDAVGEGVAYGVSDALGYADGYGLEVGELTPGVAYEGADLGTGLGLGCGLGVDGTRLGEASGLNASAFTFELGDLRKRIIKVLLQSGKRRSIGCGF